MHEGHRKRMLQRLEHAEGLQDHELLEMLLYNAIPRKNTNPLAHALLEKFNTLEEVLEASYEDLLSVGGIGPETAAYLRCIGILYERTDRRREPFPKMFSAGDFSAYLRGRLGKLGYEVVEIYAIDVNEHVLSCKRFVCGKTDGANVEPDQLGVFLAERRPAGIVLAHNHPAASCAPSMADDRFTAQLQIVCSSNNIRLFDHIIVGNDGSYSYFLVGRIDEMRRKFDVTSLVGEKLYHD